jgi:SpoVK/Ycf46/Vps4 family AAA+-type ATPase
MKSIRNPRLLYVRGATGCGRTLSVRYCCRDLGLPLIRVDMRMLAGRGEDYESSLRKIFRECRLRQSAVCFTHFEAILSDGKEAFRYSFVKMLRYGCPYVFVLSEKDWKPEYPLNGYMFIDMEIPSPGTAERIALWNGMLEGIPVGSLLSVDELAAKFSFTGGQIRGAIDKALLLAVGERKGILDSELIHRACRNLISHKLGERATLIPIRYTWDDLILPPIQKNMLRRACDQIRFSHTVYGEWSFGEKIAYGRGVSMLLTGPPGTGKTMSAQIIAGVLQLEIYKVDLSAVVSKYIGETEKNLSDVFAEVKKSQSILFFDEADAMFGKRSEVKDAHDKYANTETAYLLQKMEEYEGIVILATNFIQNFDEAFKRRIKFIIEFPFPDPDYRLAIWKAVFPERTPKDANIDYQFLASTFEMTGSGIKNAAVSAAFLAAAEGAPVTMDHILSAVLTEMRKTGKTLLKEDLKEYYYILDNTAQVSV